MCGSHFASRSNRVTPRRLPVGFPKSQENEHYFMLRTARTIDKAINTMSLKRKIKQIDSIEIKEEKVTPNKRQKKHIKIEFETVKTENLPDVQTVFDLLAKKYGKPTILKSGASESTCGRKETLCEAAGTNNHYNIKC